MTSSTALYDDPLVVAKYGKLSRHLGVESMPAWSTMHRVMLSIITPGQAILDLGCGYGCFSKLAKENGATKLHMIDNSETMLQKAQELHGGLAGVTFEKADLNQVKLPNDSFDIVYSCLAMHYLDNLEHLVKQIQRTLKQDGYFVFIVQHPIWVASDNGSWQQDKTGRHFWPVSDYGCEGPRINNWLGVGLRQYHRTLQTYVSLLLDNGFALRGLEELFMKPGEQPDGHPDSGKEMHRPAFLWICARKMGL